MKNATAKTKVSTKGQVILPKAIRDKHKWTPGTELNVDETPDGVLLTPTRYFAPTKFEGSSLFRVGNPRFMLWG